MNFSTLFQERSKNSPSRSLEKLFFNTSQINNFIILIWSLTDMCRTLMAACTASNKQANSDWLLTKWQQPNSSVVVQTKSFHSVAQSKTIYRGSFYDTRCVSWRICCLGKCLQFDLCRCSSANTVQMWAQCWKTVLWEVAVRLSDPTQSETSNL